MYAILTFDTEDIYYPPEYHIDDIAGWLAEIMTDCKIRGSFFVMGEKARVLKERGRTDVIKKMADHDIASHTQADLHPLIPEILQNKGWDDGIQLMREYEDNVKDKIYDTFGCEPVAISRHNAFFAPQHVAVAGERNLPYMYGIARIKDYDQPTWYAGTLTFPDMFDGFETIYSSNEPFEEKMEALADFLEDRIKRGCEYVTISGCHPVQVMANGWLSHYCLANGMTRKPEEIGWLYGIKSQEEENRAKANFRRLAEYLRDHPDVEVVGIKQAKSLFSSQPDNISRDALTYYAEETCSAAKGEWTAKVIFHSTFSPAELVCAFAESLIYAEEHKDLPDDTPRRNVLGPETKPVIGVEKDIITHKEIISLCRLLIDSVLSNGCLPANLYISDKRIGLGQFALVAARSYLAQSKYEKYERLCIQQVQRYPDAAFELDGWIRRSIGEHLMFSPDYTCDQMAEQARLQTWTMKPAWLRPPNGPLAYFKRILG